MTDRTLSNPGDGPLPAQIITALAEHALTLNDLTLPEVNLLAGHWDARKATEGTDDEIAASLVAALIDGELDGGVVYVAEVAS